MSFTKHFGSNNLSDLVAKDDAQMSLANALGTLTGVALLTGFHSPIFLTMLVSIACPIQLWMTLKLLDVMV